MKKNSMPMGYSTILVIFMILLFSCKKNTVDSEIVDVDKNNRVYEYIKKLGYNDPEIREVDDGYIVDGDIYFEKSSNPDFSIFGGPRTEQYGTANYVGMDYQTNINVIKNITIPYSYVSAIQAAITLWNNVPNCRVKFAYNSGTGATITIRPGIVNPECGYANFPINGEPGASAFLNRSLTDDYSFDQRVRTIAHALGHSIGLRHTNWQGLETQSGTDGGAYYDAMHLLGTPTGGDPNSLMNGGECGTGATALSPFDILAVQFLYPAAPPVVGTIPIYRYFGRATNGDHYLTPNLSDFQNGTNSNYIFEGIGMFAFVNQITNTIPVHRYSINGNDHYYSTNPLDIPPNSTYYGIPFYVYPSAINGAMPVYKYFNSSTNDHFFTKNQDEVTFMSGYVYQGIAWYAH